MNRPKSERKTRVTAAVDECIEVAAEIPPPCYGSAAGCRSSRRSVSAFGMPGLNASISQPERSFTHR